MSTANVVATVHWDDGAQVLWIGFGKSKDAVRALPDGTSVELHLSDRLKLPGILRKKGPTPWLGPDRNSDVPDRRAMTGLIENAGYKQADVVDNAELVLLASSDAAPFPQHPYVEGAEKVMEPLNQILYGPPGTGKTWRTARIAVKICDGSAPNDEAELRARYRELAEQQRIRFVSFHQSFSYEDFVEGIRPVLESEDGAADGEVRYQCLPGVFREVCQLASASRGGTGQGIDAAERRIYKISLGDTSDPGQDWVYQDSIENGRITVGFDDEIDFSEAHSRDDVFRLLHERNEGESRQSSAVQSIHYLKNELQHGDLVVVSDGNHAFRAIGEVDGDYEYLDNREWYRHTRSVHWLRIFDESLPVDQILGKIFSQRTLYRISSGAVNVAALNELLASDQSSGERRNHVLIIDEINRANISRVMGELITLLEPDKRRDAGNEIAVTLPYSRSRFTVPQNLHVIGTMNSADRSIALLDTALRRRFEFIEVPPDPSVLARREISGIDLERLLDVMNRRIEVLFDRDHRIGHAYLLSALSDDGGGINALAQAFEHRVIPLLEEYFFEDWNRIRLVLGDNYKPTHLQFIRHAYDEDDLARLFGAEHPDVGSPGVNDVWVKSPEAFLNPEAYRTIYMAPEGHPLP